MTVQAMRITIAVALLLTTAAAVNLLLLQPSRKSRDQTSLSFGELERQLQSGPTRSGAVRGAPATGSAEARPQIVQAIQRELAARGDEVGVQDGVVGAVTRAAILAFEHDHGLPLTGEPTDELLRVIILGGPAIDPARRAAHGLRQATALPPKVVELVRFVQQGLARHGYLQGKVSGELDVETVRAVREFELDKDFPAVTGRISGRLVARLAKPAAPPKAAPRRS
jgi:peptidoglycan hydrolase-like protein with peptidoglycan-binding domain